MNQTKVWVWVMIVKNNKVLLWKRKNIHEGWTWAFPWGHLEFMESFEQCAIREALEETNLKLKNISFLTITNDIYKEEKKHYVTIFVRWEVDSWELKNMEPHKCEKWEWFSWDNLPQPLMLTMENFIKQWFKI